ncbi:MAG TPA: cytochrome P450 [Acidimicrobiia bacterium]|nr:cytochrome P450 [Acidimicrobiia bacterium]
MGERPLGCPSSDVDLWAEDVLADPYPTFAELRETGPVVWLERHGLVALPRHAEVAAALADWRRFSSARGVGIDDGMNAAMGESPIASDPPAHDIYRKPLVEQLSSAALAGTAPYVGELAVRYAEAAVRAGSFDAVADLARPFSLTVVGDLVGLRPDDRDAYPALAERAFNVFGPTGPRTADGFLAVGEFIQRTLAAAEPGGLLPGGRGEQLCRLGMPMMLITYTWPGIDTTVNALATAVLLFARHPEQWDELRADRSLIPPAFNEVLRLHAPVHYFTRHATQDVDVAGVTLPAGTKVLVMYGSANRDERRFPDPDRFDIHRRADGHLAFGRGVHLCAGIHLARLEGHALLAALVDRVARFDLIAEPRWTLNNTLHGLASLHVQVVPAG